MGFGLGQYNRHGESSASVGKAFRLCQENATAGNSGSPPRDWFSRERSQPGGRPTGPACRAAPSVGGRRNMDWLHLFGRSREDQACFPELDWGHVSQRRMNLGVVVPMHVVRQLDPQLARRAERLAVDELGLQHLVGRLVDRVVVRAPLPRQRPLDAETVEHLVDLRVAELAAAVRAGHLNVGYRARRTPRRRAGRAATRAACRIG